MHISDYQQWIDDYDAARDFDRVQPSQTLAHALEELGEIAREVLYLDGYRDADDEDKRRAMLAEELADCMVFLFKLASQFGVEMEEALIASKAKAEGRFSVAEGRALAARYLARQRQSRARWLGETSG
ncbi:MAG: hypothetical protein HUU23_14905 [Caldilineales bacterium]|nr:hypothetical protein [Caldilineales bacterium]